MENVVSPEFRVSYPQVFQPKLNDLNGKQEYSLVAVFAPGTDLSLLKAQIAEAATEKFGADKTKWPANLRNPIRANEERAKQGVLPEGYAPGGFYINLKSSQKPGVVNQNVQPIIDPSEFYAGCIARASVRAYGYDQKGNRGVAFGLQNVQKVRDDAPLSGRTTAAQDFQPVAGAASSNAAASDDPFA